MFDFLYKPMVLEGNVDERYFQPIDDGKYKATPLFIRNVAKYSQNFFKYQIMKLDANDECKTKASQREVNDYEAIEAAQAPYKEAFEQFDQLWKKYKEDHPDEFDEVPFIYGGTEDELRFVSHFRPDLNISLEEAIAGYHAAKALLSKYDKGGDEYDSLPKATKIVGKSEFAAQHDKYKAKLREELGIPEPSHFAIKKTVTTQRLNSKSKKMKSVPADDSNIFEFTKQFCCYLTDSRNAELNAV